MNYSDIQKWYFIGNFPGGDKEKTKRIFNILKCFISVDKKILFKHYFFKLDDMDREVRSEIIEDDYNAFCNGVMLYHIPENKVKTESLIKNVLYENLKDYIADNRLNENEKKQLLFDKLCRKDLNEINGELLNNVKELICRSISEEYLPEVDNFIKERIIFKNSIDVSFRKTESKRPIECVWYYPKNDDEIIRAIEIEGGFLQCIVILNFNDFNDYLYAFELFEQNDDVLAVNDRCGDFVDKVIPKLNVILNDGKCNILNEVDFNRQ